MTRAYSQDVNTLAIFWMRIDRQRRVSRKIIYSTDFTAVNDVMAYLTENCWGSAVACGPVCQPAATGTAQTSERNQHEKPPCAHGGRGRVRSS